MNHVHVFNSIIGAITLVEDKGCIVRIELKDGVVEVEEAPTQLLRDAEQQIACYLDGVRHELTFPINPQGTPFQLRVWKALQEIPYGETCTYGTIAEKIGNPHAARAVGMACNKNPLLLIIPCHRVVGRNGVLTGFAAGLEVKRRLLEMEQGKRPACLHFEA